MNTFQILACIGILLSLYTYYVELHTKRVKGYKAVCDINDRMSCTKAVTSKYGKMFGISNSLIGLGYYALVFILSTAAYTTPLLILTILGCLASLCLAYISYIKMKNFCVVCTATYVVNFLLLIAALA
jgi:vitamin-K-epoxide reductase (warfarin-sensitive)